MNNPLVLVGAAAIPAIVGKNFLQHSKLNFRLLVLMTNFTVCHNLLSMKIRPHVFDATPPVPWVLTNQQLSRVGWTKTCFLAFLFLLSLENLKK